CVAHRLARHASPHGHRRARCTDRAHLTGRTHETGGGPVIPRYAPTEMAELFSDEARFAMWLRVELLATDGWVLVGDVPAEAAAICRERAPHIDAAFVDA